jgi:hypothetical protein
VVSMPGSAPAPCNADLRVQAARVTTVSRGARPVVQLSAGDAIEMAAARRLFVVPAGLLPECRPGERLDGPGGSDVLLAGVGDQRPAAAELGGQFARAVAGYRQSRPVSRPICAKQPITMTAPAAVAAFRVSR